MGHIIRNFAVWVILNRHEPDNLVWIQMTGRRNKGVDSIFGDNDVVLGIDEQMVVVEPLIFSNDQRVVTTGFLKEFLSELQNPAIYP